MENLSIKGFKCFSNTTVKFNNLTVLVGANGYGKSSTIQALLLLKQAMDNSSNILLNGIYGLELGTVSDIVNQNTPLSTIEVGFKDEDNDKTLVNCVLDIQDKIEDLVVDYTLKKESFCRWFSVLQFYYISAEREGPRTSQKLFPMEFLHCGTRGEYTAQVLGTNAGMTKIDTSRMYPNSKNPYLNFQVNEWLSFMFPGVKVSANVDTKLLRAAVRVSNQYAVNDVQSTNMGFGVSYVLPIIVDGLVAEKGSTFIVENPEAHLHPAAQTSIGWFIAMIAYSGVNVIVETHSDHVIDGIQLFGLSNKEWLSSVLINNYGLKDGMPLVTPISFDENGDYSEWPEGFMDQTQINYMKKLKIQKQ